MQAAERRQALGHFLRYKREQISPGQVGLPPGSRRRTAGLRREEVAELAGISTAWYTYLEQGRDVQPSREALAGIANALRLSDIERSYLCALALPDPAPPAARADIPLSLRRLIDTLNGYPACVIGHTWDILAWNQAYCRLFTDFEARPPSQRNLIRYVFTDAGLRAMYMDWEGNARRLLAEFRLSFGLYAGEPRFVEIISELLYLSEEFAHWWTDHQVHARGSGIKDMLHPQVGRLQLEYATFQSNDNPRLSLITYTPVNKESEEKLSQLTAAYPCDHHLHR